jgi:hypothetical protein
MVMWAHRETLKRQIRMLVDEERSLHDRYLPRSAFARSLRIKASCAKVTGDAVEFEACISQMA